MKDNSLLKRLRSLGFSLFETGETEDVNLTLADVVKSKDLRLWEGFPVVLATSAENGHFDYTKTVDCLKRESDKLILASLTAMSLALYKALNLKFLWADTLARSLNVDRRKELEAYFNLLKKGQDLKVAGRSMSSERLKSVFNSYFKKADQNLNDYLCAKEELGLEYALSQVFPPKQKELFLKKLKGEALTKTEKEYFSRTVKKKVHALANADLHRLSRRLLE
ncbi:MAG: hypothetical protein NTY34_03085 [Candidatus Omnitrophica bacterium]|nr:hypothetical protein [Candidatus Omnitrophota bacterium]